jgi:hypothetical protein
VEAVDDEVDDDEAEAVDEVEELLKQDQKTSV